MSRLIYICDWLPPDFGAVGQYSLHFARAYADEGHDVVLVGLSSQGSSEVTEQVGRGTLTIVRLNAGDFEKDRWRHRLIWTMKTNCRIMAASFKYLRWCDRIVFTGSPPFMIHFIMPLNLFLRKTTVYRITDFHPECLMASLGSVPLLLRLLHRYTCMLRRRVERFEVLGHDQARHLEKIGIVPERMTLKRDPAPVTITGTEVPLQVPATIAGSVVLLYSGNFGVAHDANTLIDGYLAHHRAGNGRVGLWLNATGIRADAVEKALAKAGVPFARTQPVPLEQLPRLLMTADAHLITLQNDFIGYVMPSKVYGCIATRRSIVYIGGAESDVDLLCRQSEAFYQRVEVGDAAAFAAALERLADHVAKTAARHLLPFEPRQDEGSRAERRSDVELAAARLA